MRQAIMSGCVVAGNVILLSLHLHDGVGEKIFFVVVCAACYFVGFLGGQRVQLERMEKWKHAFTAAFVPAFVPAFLANMSTEGEKLQLAASAALARVGDPLQ